jgi:protein-disulfide isomerase
MDDSISLDISVRAALAAVFGLGLIIGVAVGGAGALTLQDSSETTQPSTQDTGSQGDTAPQPSESDSGSESGTQTVSVSDLNLEGERTMGSSDAEVTLVYFGDFNCMYCYRFAQQSLPQIRDNFVESGDVRVVYKNLITMGENSVTLAKASEAAWNMVGEENPDLYWEFHSQLHADQEERKQNSQPVMEDIMDTAEKVEGIDSEELRNEMDSITEEQVTQDVQAARQRGITGTPGFIVFETGTEEGTPIQGAQPYSNFESEINNLLEN